MRIILKAIFISILLFTGTFTRAQPGKIHKKHAVSNSTSKWTAPSFPGGDATLHTYLDRRIRYPKQAAENGIQGKVILSFFINENGTAEDIRIIREIGGGCGREAVRVVSQMPAWIPGTYRGKKIKMLYELPVSFKIID